MKTKPKRQIIRTHVFISGEVQGVYFRDYTRRKAQALGLTGWVRNLRDGRVEAVFEGEAKAVQQAVDWCYVGSPYAQVESVEVSYEEPSGVFDGFHITW